MQASTSKSVLRAARTACTSSSSPSHATHRAIVSLAPRHRSPLAAHVSKRSFFSLPDISKLANLAGSVNEERAIESDGDIQKFHARKVLPYTPEQLYSLVSDVPSYSSFIPFCTGSTVLQPSSPGARKRVWEEWKPDSEPFDVNAELKVGFGGLEEKYVSRVVGKPFESVTATASEGGPLFKSLTTSWSFSPAPSLVPTSMGAPASTLLTIDLAFAFANPLHRIASQAVLPRVADKMVDAFEKRCKEEWGRS
ncbi:dehydrase and lipid transport-domain-containing protein [Kockovaella imperatae]|uniref:Dehydrase and lipid transport-domain-containing protein n=1 Tax=Kockovaella imperatae TaxID=4999 RepID=A0A1Y1UJV5_9TREE|nr:dehydrase and lipid transport-domain-containing protein [Kockovaella imperatae]ORX37784.1 dehydrase and lipid transport-domain-containing protein [Kockovaella imperatae]